ncbi:hypothetical protein RD792_012597 [Penstemon davidsonii]|uniref:Carbonic anhydrase n=1 Tax=Penstemon davidsonii TaxID=160366 RepID=A0ABR0CXB2_9LAMI|nr:hypothetical protein RD792_012597 [Penstemon davidsonii]
MYVDDEKPFTYMVDKENGPDNWGHVNKSWETCATGKFQSPIDLHNKRVEEVGTVLGSLKRAYKPGRAAMKNRGHDIMVEWKDYVGGVVINGTKYDLKQAHWHTPSEHTVNGKSFKMELHMLHRNSLGQNAVIGILYKSGSPDPYLGKFLKKIESSKKEGDEYDVGVVDPLDIKFGSRKYYRYIGSLTVPPCTEGVLWTILKKVRTVSLQQTRALRAAVNDDFENNARPTQNLDGRSVYMYRPN